MAIFFSVSIEAAADKPKSIDFAGRLTAVDQASRMMTVQGKKAFVFKVDTSRCEINRNGFYFLEAGATRGGLSDAKVGDAVVGKLSLAGSEPVVVELFFMANPRYAIPVPNKPGFVSSPYAAINVLSHLTAAQKTIDVRGRPRGTMVLDAATGKIFLVP